MMSFTFISIFAVFCCCFILCYLWLSAVSRNISSIILSSALAKDVFSPMIIMSFIGCLALTFTVDYNYDFIYSFSRLDLLTAFISAAVIYAAAFRHKLARYVPVLIFAAAASCTFFLPAEFRLFDGHLPLVLDRLTIILIWTAFSWCYFYLNGLDGIISSESLAIPGGLVLLSLFGAVPALIGGFGAVYTAVILAFYAYNRYPARLVMPRGGCTALGFLLGWLALKGAEEGVASCILIFALYYFVEAIYASAKRLSLQPQHKDLVANTNYYQIDLSGLAPNIIADSLLKLQLLLWILGCFQVYAPNNFSLLLLSLLLTVWFINKLYNWETGHQTLKEINQEVIQDIKNNVSEITKKIDKDL